MASSDMDVVHTLRQAFGGELGWAEQVDQGPDGLI